MTTHGRSSCVGHRQPESDKSRAMPSSIQIRFCPCCAIDLIFDSRTSATDWLMPGRSRAAGPIRRQAGDGDQEIKRLVPERRSPRLGDRGTARGEAGDERGKAVAVDDLALGLGRDRFQEFAVGLEAGELVGRGLSRPAGLSLADDAPVRRGRGRSNSDRPRALRERTSPRTPRLRAASGSASSVRFSPPGKSIRKRPSRCRAADTRRRAPVQRDSTPGVAESALGRTETSTRPGTSPTSQRTV